MAKLFDYIKVIENFQYAINIGYDLYSDDKIKNYIPTASAIDIIEEIMLSTSDSSNSRARIFTGPYGKGKSHLALVLLALLCRDDNELYSNILSFICKSRPELCEYIKDYHKQGKKMLPVVIQGSGMGIRQSFLYGLKVALDEANLDGFMPDTYFESAIKAIQNWELNYPQTYKAFKKNITGSTNEFINELKAYNSAFYSKFIEIYPTLTSGSEFNPISGLDIVSLYRDVVSKISQFGYSGIFVVFDEFSKQLEGNMNRISGDEIKALQDFAEYCDRSQSNQIHVLLISHKSMLNYASGLSKADIDAWKAVSNRFKPIELNTTTIQTYDLMSKVMDYDTIWKLDFTNKFKSDFNSLYSAWRRENIFADINESDFNNICYNCFPLSPITSFMLPKISEEIAQNERTLFTFLSSNNQKYTLPRFLQRTSADSFSLITPDVIFDYFEPLFKGESYDKPTHKYWKLATSAIDKLEKGSSLEVKIIKTIALICIIDRFDVLSPSSEIITKIYGYGKTKRPQIIKVLTTLEQDNILVNIGNKNYLKIAEQSGENIPELINNETVKVKSAKKIVDILNDFVGNRVLYPNAYNDEHYIVRYFKFKFISEEDVIDGKFDIINDCSEDGIVYAVLQKEISSEELINAINNLNNNRFVFIVPNGTDLIEDNIYKYSAISSYINECDDTVLIDELSYSLVIWEEYINSLVDLYIKPEKGNSLYFYDGEQQQVNTQSNLSMLLSDICNELYFRLPIINNEMINKNNISTQTANSRYRIIDALLQNNIEENLGFTGNGQETTIMRSLLVIPGILIKDNDCVCIQTNNCNDDNFNHLFNTIRDFIISSSEIGPRSFGELYHILTSAEYSIGLKKGVVPIYIACVLKAYKKYTVITKNKREIEITSRLLESINERPNDYCIYIESWNAEKERYINELEDMFSVFVRKSEAEYSNFDYIVKAIQRWYLQLPKYSVQAKSVYDDNNQVYQLNRDTINFFNAFKVNEINARELLFEKIFKLFGYDVFCLDVLQNINTAKSLVDNAKPNLIKHLIIELKRIFGNKTDKKEKSLYSVMLDWYESIPETAKNHMYNGIENQVLYTIGNITHDEISFVESLAKVVSELRIDDWAEVTIHSFINSMEDFKASVEGCEVNITETNFDGIYRLSFINSDGQEIIKTFDKTNYSGMAELMYSEVEAMISEYGEAISKNEKRQILIDIINNLLG